MGGHFDAVGFGDPTLGFEATREHLRAAVERGRRVGEVGEVVYYELESPEGCGLCAATDKAGFLLNGCPYFAGRYAQLISIESFGSWEAGEQDQGGARGRLQNDDGTAGPDVAFALPGYALEAARVDPGPRRFVLVGLGYRARSQAGERRTWQDGRPSLYFESIGLRRDLPPIRRCNVECRGRIERAELFTNSQTGAPLTYALLDCDEARLEVVIDRPSLSGGLAEGAYLEGSFWLVGRPA